MNLDKLVQHIQIESEARLRDSLDNQGKIEKLHNVEGPVFNSRKSVFKSQHEKKSSFKKRKLDNFNKKEFSNKKKKGLCYVCDKIGYLAKDCHYRKGQKNMRLMWYKTKT